MRSLLVLVFLALLAVGCAETSERPDQGSKAPAKPCETAASPETTTTESRETSQGTELRAVVIETSGGEEAKVWVEIADNTMGRIIGLRGRKSLPENRGMLFVYTEEDDRSFTMEDTLIPLSIAFMDSGGCIVDIQHMEPQTDGYDSAKPAQYALEVNQGFFEEHGVEVGDRARLPG